MGQYLGVPNFRIGIAIFALALGLFAAPRPASALPVFAHRYGFSCQQCHTTVPQLNAFGQYFMHNGFRLGGGARGVFPVAVKVALAYSSAGTSDEGAAPLPKAIVDEVEILSAGSLGPNASYYFENYAVDGGEPGRPRDIWADVRQPLTSDPLGPQLHARIGDFTLPLPVDPETQRPTLSHYGIFDQTVGTNTFNLFDPRLGTDLYLTDDRRGFAGHLVLAQAVDRGSGFPSDGVDVMGSLSKTLGPDFTAYAYRYQGNRALGPVHDRFHRDGYGVGYERNKIEAQAVLQHGGDSSADGFGLGLLSAGGFLQTGWHFSGGLSLYYRYDNTYDRFNLRQAADTLSLVMRPARNFRFTLEGTRQSDRTYQLGAGLLFAY